MGRRLFVPAILAILAGVGGCPAPVDVHPDLGDGGGPANSLCADGVRDQDESDVDCGGTCGATCLFGDGCRVDGDCMYGKCMAGQCTPTGSTCFDHARDGSETDVDCGGTCPRCASGKMCSVAADCASGTCAGGVCTGKPPVAFGAPRFIDVRARGLISLVAADFDGDGRLDAATLAYVASQVVVVLGRGDGTFNDPLPVSLGSMPGAFDVGDLDGDGHPDVLVTLPDGGQALPLLWRAGTLVPLPAVAVAACARPTDLALADVDGDQRLDALLSCTGPGGDMGPVGMLAVLLGNGDGTFRSGPAVPLGGTVSSVVAGAFHSGGPLAAAALVDYQPMVVRGDGRGGFSMPVALPAPMYPWFLIARDLQKHGVLDLVVSSFQGQVAFLAGAGDGTFAAPVSLDLGGAPGAMETADFDGDGKLDLATANQGPNAIQVLRGHGDGAFDTAIGFYVGGSVQDLAVGDFNGDGKPDIALCDYRTHDVGVMINQSGQ